MTYDLIIKEVENVASLGGESYGAGNYALLQIKKLYDLDKSVRDLAAAIREQNAPAPEPKKAPPKKAPHRGSSH